MVWGAVIGAVGSVISNRSSSKAAESAAEAAEFRPYDVYGSSGNLANFDRARGTLTTELGADNQALRSIFSSSAIGIADPTSSNSLLADQLQTYGNDISSLFADLQGTQEFTSQQAQGTAQYLGGLRDQQSAVGRSAIDQAFGAPTAASLTGTASSLAQDYLSNTGTSSFNDLAAQRLSALRTAARPSEERAVDSKFNSLFSSGRLGTTGGQRGIGELALQQELADQSRVINSQDFANSQLNQERSFLQNQQSLGSNLLSQAFGGIAQDQNQAANFGTLGTSLLNSSGGTEAARLSAVQTGDQAALSRAQQRLDGAQQIFGFGDSIKQNDLDSVFRLLGGAQSIDSAALEEAKLGASVGQAQAAAGANAGQLTMQGASSPLGSALQGIGTGISNSNKSFSDLFKRDTTTNNTGGTG